MGRAVPLHTPIELKREKIEGSPIKNYKHIFVVIYRKIPNISPGLIEVRKHFLGGLYSGGLIFGGHLVLVSEYQDLKIHCYILLL